MSQKDRYNESLTVAPTSPKDGEAGTGKENKYHARSGCTQKRGQRSEVDNFKSKISFPA